MKSTEQFEDYTINRTVIDELTFYGSGQIETKKGMLFVSIPEKVRREMKITTMNAHEFKMIIVRK